MVLGEPHLEGNAEIVALLLSLYMWTLSSASWQCDIGWQLSDTICLSSIPGRFTFEEATRECESEGAKLAKAESEIDVQRLTKIINLTPERTGWVGAYRNSTTDEMVWQTDQSPLVRNGAKIESDHCFVMLTGLGVISPLNCSTAGLNEHQALCEKQAVWDNSTSLAVQCYECVGDCEDPYTGHDIHVVDCEQPDGGCTKIKNYTSVFGVWTSLVIRTCGQTTDNSHCENDDRLSVSRTIIGRTNVQSEIWSCSCEGDLCNSGSTKTLFAAIIISAIISYLLL